MIFSWILAFSLFVGDTEGGSCKVPFEYETIKTQLDNYLPRRYEVCDEMHKFHAEVDKYLSSRVEYCYGSHIPTDCSMIKKELPDAKDRIYRIKPADGKESFLVFCDMESDEHGWLVFQTRKDGSVDFFRDWFTYMRGFGNLTGEFWLGNEYIHRLTNQGNYTLRVNMTDTKKVSTYAEYSHFHVGNMSIFYTMTVSGYSGTAGDKLTQHSKMRFSARNLDLDDGSSHCAQAWKGGWWYKSCHYSNLNGLYGSISSTGIRWGSTTMKQTTMKLRPLHLNQLQTSPIERYHHHQ